MRTKLVLRYQGPFVNQLSFLYQLHPYVVILINGERSPATIRTWVYDRSMRCELSVAVRTLTWFVIVWASRTRFVDGHESSEINCENMGCSTADIEREPEHVIC